MSMKSILAYLPNKKTAARLTRTAGNLGLEINGHLIGFHAIPPFPIYGAMAAEVSAEIIETQNRILKEEAEETRAEFERVMNSLGVQAEWRCMESWDGDKGSSVTALARNVDLVVIDQGADEDYLDSKDLPARLVLESGRPVLVIPSFGEYSEIGRNILLAWNNSRESARACFDALPFMKRADEVKILTINQESDFESKSFSPVDDLALSLSRHDIKVETHNVAHTTISVSNEILSRAADFGSDLLVMGCYGHSRLRETVFGGVTRDILKSMSLPVLMSH